MHISQVTNSRVRRLRDDETRYKVVDLLATEAPRTHDLLGDDGNVMKFTFTDNVTPQEVPVDLAMKLVGNSGFEVMDDKGRIISGSRVKTTDGLELDISSDQCLANYDELTLECLIERANSLGGHYSVPKMEFIAPEIGEVPMKKVGKGNSATEEVDVTAYTKQLIKSFNEAEGLSQSNHAHACAAIRDQVISYLVEVNNAARTSNSINERTLSKKQQTKRAVKEVDKEGVFLDEVEMV